MIWYVITDNNQHGQTKWDLGGCMRTIELRHGVMRWQAWCVRPASAAAQETDASPGDNSNLRVQQLNLARTHCTARQQLTNTAQHAGTTRKAEQERTSPVWTPKC